MTNLNTYHLATWADSAKTRNPTRPVARVVVDSVYGRLADMDGHVATRGWMAVVDLGVCKEVPLVIGTKETKRKKRKQGAAAPVHGHGRTGGGATAFSGNGARRLRQAAAAEGGGGGGSGGAAQGSGTVRRWRTASPELGEEREKYDGAGRRRLSLGLYRWQQGHEKEVTTTVARSSPAAAAACGGKRGSGGTSLGGGGSGKGEGCGGDIYRGRVVLGGGVCADGDAACGMARLAARLQRGRGPVWVGGAVGRGRRGEEKAKPRAQRGLGVGLPRPATHEEERESWRLKKVEGGRKRKKGKGFSAKGCLLGHGSLVHHQRSQGCRLDKEVGCLLGKGAGCHPGNLALLPGIQDCCLGKQRVGVGVDLGIPGCHLDSQGLHLGSQAHHPDSLCSLLADLVHGAGSLEEHLDLVVEVEAHYPEHGASEEHHEAGLGPALSDMLEYKVTPEQSAEEYSTSQQGAGKEYVRGAHFHVVMPLTGTIFQHPSLISVIKHQLREITL
uniref:Uncharacterized protein n=1 Tax=Oryza punctata TaxID=4537 RepID=A0A0E0LYK3_ORYPU